MTQVRVSYPTTRAQITPRLPTAHGTRGTESTTSIRIDTHPVRVLPQRGKLSNNVN